MAFSFRSIFRRLLPHWLLDGDGEKVHYSHALLFDAMSERLRQGIRARFPADAPEDALALIGRDRRITRGFAEPSDNYRLRLPGFLNEWRLAGAAWPMLHQLLGYCGYLAGGMVVRTVDNRGNWNTIDAAGATSSRPNAGNWNWDGDVDKWARFWPILYPPAELWTQGPTLGDPDLWGGAIGTPGYTVGSTATPEQVAAVKHIVREWKPAGTRCPKVVVAFDADDFEQTDLTPPNPDGDWNEPDNRIANAAYWNPNT